MIPGISGGGGGVKIDSNPISGADQRINQDFKSSVGGNRGVRFSGRGASLPVDYIAVGVAVLLAAYLVMRKRG